eukprot:GHVS01028230.1.p1 GENE.GHVS01028230.1~~GHVS01028230.1.p1  ORF type:complete len:741 (+),score=128.55 GHVS01028230.1:224-2446(+)
MLNRRVMLLLATAAISVATGCLASLGSETGLRHLLPSSGSFSSHFSTYVPGSQRTYEASPNLDSSFFSGDDSVDSSRVFWEPTDGTSEVVFVPDGQAHRGSYFGGASVGGEGSVAHEENHPQMHVSDVMVDASSSEQVGEEGKRTIVDESHTSNVFNAEGVTSHYAFQQPIEEAVETKVEEKKVENKPSVVEVSHRHIQGSDGSSADDWNVVIGGKTYKLNPEWISAITNHIDPEQSEVEDVTTVVSQTVATVGKTENEEVQKVVKTVEFEKEDLPKVEKPDAAIQQHVGSAKRSSTGSLWSTHRKTGGLLPAVEEIKTVTKEDQLSEAAQHTAVVTEKPKVTLSNSKVIGAETEHEDLVGSARLSTEGSTARKNEQQLHERHHKVKNESFSSEAVNNLATTNSLWGNNVQSLLSDEARLAALFRSAVLSLMQQQEEKNHFEEAVFVEKPKARVATKKEAHYKSNQEKKVSVVDTIEKTTQADQQQQKSVGVSQLDHQTAAEKKRLPSSAVKSEGIQSGMTESFAETAVRLHNEYRSGRRGANGPLAKPLNLLLPSLEWDDNLAGFIDSWLDDLVKDESCGIQHSSNSMRSNIAGWEGVPIGENLFKFSTTRPIEQVDIQAAISSWYNEISCYRYGPFQHPKKEPGCQQCAGGSKEKGCEQCDLGSHIGHFTQIMWEGSKKIGCGYKLCDHKQLAGFKSVLIGCEYGSAGNMVGRVPFGEVVAEKLILVAQPDSCAAGQK